MRRFILLASIVVGAALGLAAWLQGQPVDFDTNKPAKLGKIMSFGILPWAYSFIAYGLVLTTYITVTKLSLFSQIASKHTTIAKISILFGPVFALLLELAAMLVHFSILDTNGVVTLIAVFQFLFVGLGGNYIATTRRGQVGGLRNRWTMQSDLVWSKAHRLYGWGLVAVSVSAMAALFFVSAKSALRGHVLTMFILVASVIFYSRALSRREQAQSH